MNDEVCANFSKIFDIDRKTDIGPYLVFLLKTILLQHFKLNCTTYVSSEG